MAEPTRKMFSPQELITMMIKEAGETEGYWALATGFTLAAGHAGPTPDQAIPTAFLGVAEIGIERVEESAPMAKVDAASVHLGRTKPL